MTNHERDGVELAESALLDLLVPRSVTSIPDFVPVEIPEPPEAAPPTPTYASDARHPKLSKNGIPLGRRPGSQMAEKARKRRTHERQKPKEKLEFDESLPLPHLKPYKPYCTCGTCHWCQDEARWDRIFKEKFENPEYYTKPDTFERLRSDHLANL